MKIEQALRTHLVNDAAVGALVGTRVYPDRAPQDATIPWIVYQRISTPRVRSHDGPSGLASPRFQLMLKASTRLAADTLAEKVRYALDGYKGTMGGGGGVSVGDVILDNERAIYEEVTKEFTVQLDFIIWHQEATA